MRIPISKWLECPLEGEKNELRTLKKCVMPR